MKLPKDLEEIQNQISENLESNLNTGNIFIDVSYRMGVKRGFDVGASEVYKKANEILVSALREIGIKTTVDGMFTGHIYETAKLALDQWAKTFEETNK